MSHSSLSPGQGRYNNLPIREWSAMREFTVHSASRESNLAFTSIPGAAPLERSPKIRLTLRALFKSPGDEVINNHITIEDSVASWLQGKLEGSARRPSSSKV